MTTDDDALLAVVAHGLLGAVTSISGAVKTLRAHPDAPAEVRDSLLEMIEVQSEHLAEVLLDLVRAAPATRTALDSLATPEAPAR